MTTEAIKQTEPANTVTRMEDAIAASATECSPAHAARLRTAWTEMQNLLRGWQGVAGDLQNRSNENGDELARTRTQLAGCLGAAEGLVAPPYRANEGDYGWSPAYESTVQLALKAQRLEKAIDDIDTARDQHRPSAADPASVDAYVNTVETLVQRAKAPPPAAGQEPRSPILANI